jgi:hypothetical protein
VPADQRGDANWREAVVRARETLARIEKWSAELGLARAEYEKLKAKYDRKEATLDELNSAAAKYIGIETALRLAVLEHAEWELRLQQLAPYQTDLPTTPPTPAPAPDPAPVDPPPPKTTTKPQPEAGPLEVIRPQSLPQPQNKLPARNGFPNPQTDLALAQLELDVWTVRLEGSKLEFAQLREAGASQVELDAARNRVDAAQAATRAAEEKVLKTSKVLYGW